jgi:cytochrome c556
MVQQKQTYEKYDIAHNTGTIPVQQKKPYDKYNIAQNTGTIPVEQKQPYDKYDIAQNTGTIQCYIIFVIMFFHILQEWFMYYVQYDICHKVVFVLHEWFLYYVLYHICHKVLAQNTGTIHVEQKQPYDKYNITENTGTIPVEQEQPYDKYDIAQNTGICHNVFSYSTGMVHVLCAI